jgi:hypothetical protein
LPSGCDDARSQGSRAPSNVARRDSNNRIVARSIRRRASKHFDADYALLQGFEVTGDCLFDDISQKLAAAMTALKRSSINQFLQMQLQ